MDFKEFKQQIIDNISIEEIITKAIKLSGVHIERDKFLRANFSRRYEYKIVEQIVATSPILANIPSKVLKQVGKECINYELFKVVALSMCTGVAGGNPVLIAGAISADLIQYYAHIFRIAQKLMYLYGWPEIEDFENDVDEKTKSLLLVFLAVMMGVEGANDLLIEIGKFYEQIIFRNLAKQALTKQVWYATLKEISKKMFVRINKQMIAKIVSKVGPGISILISGGLTTVSFKKGAKRLHQFFIDNPVKINSIQSSNDTSGAI